GLAVLGSIRSARHIAQALAVVAEMVATEGAFVQAARLLGAAFTLQEHLAATLDADERADLDATLAAARAALGDEAFARAWAAGQALSPEQAITCALEPAPPE